MANGVLDVGTLAQSRMLKPIRPDKLAKMAGAWYRWGTSPALGSVVTAIHYPDDVAIIDELGSLTFAETHARSNALARTLREEGLELGDGVAIMCRNHRGFIEATMACSKLGVNALYLNTAFAGPQLTEVLEREQPAAIVYDEEFADLLSDAPGKLPSYVAWDEGACSDPSLEDMIDASGGDDLDPPEEGGRFVILTSGTTGTPKGAQRPEPEGIGALAAVLSKIPMRSRQTTMIAAPLFHSWGFTHFILGLPARHDPRPAPAIRSRGHAARDRGAPRPRLAVVPVMMQRILELPEDVRRRYDVRGLEVTAASGSALPGELATRWMDEFGDNLYNLYGSTEVAWATIATPRDMRAAPGTAGRPPRGTVVKIFDADGNELPPGETGRIFVGNEMQFEGYTGGGGKEAIDGLLSSRRRRPLRRERAPVHRRPRRRDDRLGRRERFPARDRGCARRPRGGCRGSRRSGSPTRSSVSG